MSTQTPSTNTNTSPKALIKQLVAAATSGTVFNGFLLTHLGEDVQGAVSPRYGLNKPETIKRFAEAFAFAAGGTATLVAVMEESIRGWRWPGPACCCCCASAAACSSVTTVPLVARHTRGWRRRYSAYRA